MLKIHNTLSGVKEEFQPLEQNQVRMFVCGPTVYDYIHVGNARTFVFFDVVGRYLEFKGFELNYVQNITDIDDKIITRAHTEGKKPEEIALEYKTAFIDDMGALKVASVNNYALASEHIAEIITQVKALIEKGYAYTAPAIKAAGPDAVSAEGNHDVYFELARYEKDFPNQYGRLSGQKIEELKESTRVEMEANKLSPRDFTLWKAQNYSYEPTNESPWGLGRPGWHIEDTAISEKYLGQQYDIHGGGQDLIFPHHEAEIAQQQALSGKAPFVKYWMHGGFLISKADKMSKSLGNVSTLRDVTVRLSHHPAETLRLYFLSAHYRSPLAFDNTLVDQASVAIDRIADFLARLTKITHSTGSGQAGEENPAIDEILKSRADKFTSSMDDDFNVPAAIASVFELIRVLNPLLSKNALSAGQAETIKTFFQTTVERILGIVPEPKEQSIPPEILELAEQREQHRTDQDWSKADTLRSRIESSGFTISDTPYGPLISNK